MLQIDLFCEYVKNVLGSNAKLLTDLISLEQTLCQISKTSMNDENYSDFCFKCQGIINEYVNPYSMLEDYVYMNQLLSVELAKISKKF